MDPNTTEQLEKRLHTLIYQHGLKHFIKLLENRVDMYQMMESSKSDGGEIEVINLNEIASNTNVPPESTTEPEPPTPEPSQVEMTPEYLAMLIKETYTNVVQFANDYSNIFIAPHDELTSDEVDMLVQLNSASKIKDWIEQHLSTSEYKFPDVLNFDRFNVKQTTSGYKSYLHLYDDLFILMDEDVIIYKNKHQYPDLTGRFLSALEVCLDVTNLIINDDMQKLPVDHSDYYENINHYIQLHPNADLCEYMKHLVKDYECNDQQRNILTHLINLELYHTSLNEQIFFLDLLKVFTPEQITKITKTDIDIYRRYYQYKIHDYTKIPVSDPTYIYFSTYQPIFVDLEKVKRILRHWSTINRAAESNLLPLVCL